MRYASGTVSLSSLVRELRRGNTERRWATQSLSNLLQNPVYVGRVVWCRRPHDPVERAERAVRPRDEWIVTEHAHPALVSDELFTQVQARLGQNRRELRLTVGGYALTGLLRCGACGEPYIGAGGPKGPPEDPDRYRFYRCRGQKGVGWTCTGPSGILPRRLVEPAVVDAVAQVVADPSVQTAIAEALDEALAVSGAHAVAERLEAEHRRQALAAERERLVQAIAKGVLTAEDVREPLAVVRSELERLSAAAEQSRFEERRVQALESERARLLCLASDFPTLARRVQGLALRELLRPWIQEAEVDLTSRHLTLTVRRVPAASVLLVSSTTPGRD